MATNLSNIGSILLPPTITGPIFNKATEQSAVMARARRVPLAVNAATAIPVPMDVPVAGWVSEGGVKPASEVGVGFKTMTGKKCALLLPFSKEVVMSGSGALYQQAAQDLPTALARAFDQAAVNGKDLRSGGTGPFPEWLSQTPNSVALGTASQGAGGIYADLVTGLGKVVDKNYDFDGFVADPRLLPDVMLSTDTTGRPLVMGQDASAFAGGGGTGSLIGFPASYSKGISGRYWRAGDKTQTLTVNGSPTGGTFTVSSGGNSYTAAYNVTASALQTAIRAWGTIYGGVTVSLSGSVYTVTFPDATSNVGAESAPFSTSGANLTGGTNPSVTVAATGAGGVDTNLRAIGGDWTQCAYGVGMDITMEVSTQASYWDGSAWHSAFQENLVLMLVEAYFGFVVGNVNAFVAYTKGTASF